MQIEVIIPGQNVRRYDLAQFFSWIDEATVPAWQERVMWRELVAERLLKSFQSNIENAYPGVVFYKIFQSKMNNDGIPGTCIDKDQTTG